MFTVYFVDDDPFLLQDISGRPIWQECGFEVVGKADSPQAALEEIPRLAPHLVVCDLKMPGLDGVTLMNRLKAIGITSEFVMLSAHANFQDSRDFFIGKGFDYLLKPVDEIELQITLERLSRRLFEKHGFLSDTVPAAGEGEATIDSVMAYLQHHYQHKITLSHLGETFHLNPNYICNLFAKHYGQTFTTILTSLRMKEAARLMTHTEKPLKKIAQECGYSNYFYFCRVFKEYYGCTPGEYS